MSGRPAFRRVSLIPLRSPPCRRSVSYISRHKPMTFEELEDLEGLNFDLIVTLSPPAHHKALNLTRKIAAEVEYWPTLDPTVAEGNREQRLGAYREVRDELMARIRERFARSRGGNE